MPDLTGYDLGQHLYSGPRTVVYRARRAADGAQVVLKFLREPDPRPADRARLSRELQIAGALAREFVIKPLALEQAENGPVLVLEDVGGVSLRSTIPDSGLPRERALSLAIGLARALAHVHERGVIHRDICPDNVIHLPTDAVRLIDFGLATRLGPELIEPHRAEGTVRYMSPEQTGRINRQVDSRSDLYSLGVTLFELLSGAPPFQHSDASELVHAQIAVQPPSLASLRPDVGPALAAIVDRLLKKEPKARYQSAMGLLSDLSWAAERGPSAYFDLAKRDANPHFAIASALYGRERERNLLMSAFEHVADGGGPALVLVHGPSGIGKSALVREVEQPLSERGGHFGAGKFDQLKRRRPYGAVAEALNELLTGRLTESEASMQRLREDLIAQLGPNLALLVDLVPALAAVVGAAQPAPPDLIGQEAHNRLMWTFRRFVSALAGPEHPVTLFVDDLQWADLASLQLLSGLLTDGQLQQLLVVGAYRDNEVDGAHPLMQLVAELSGLPVAVNSLQVGPLHSDALQELLSDSLRKPKDRVLELSTLLLERTGGNPFFARQSIAALDRRGHIAFEPSTGGFQVDLEAARALPATDNVVDLMVTELRRLPPPCQAALTNAAAVGNHFALTILAAVADVSVAELARALWPALKLGMLLPVSESGPACDPDLTGDDGASAPAEVTAELAFAHDRIQQAAYALSAEASRPALHLRIGRLLRDRAGERGDASLFATASQLNVGRHLIADLGEQRALAKINLDACRKARASAAFQQALLHAEIAYQLVEANPDESLTALIIRELAECSYLTGNHARAEEQFGELLELTAAREVRGEVQALRLALYESSGRYVDNLVTGYAALADLGIHLPRGSEAIARAVEQERLALFAQLRSRPIESLLDAAPMEGSEPLIAQRLLVHMAAPAYLVSVEKCQLVVLKAANLSLEHGHSSLSALSYAWLGVVMTTAWGKYDLAHALGRLALGLLDRYPNPALECKLYVLWGLFITHWKEPLIESEAAMRRALSAGQQSGDLAYAGYAAVILSRILFTRGVPLAQLQNTITGTYPLLTRAHSGPMADHQRCLEHTVLALTEPRSNPLDLDREEFREAEALERMVAAQFRAGVAYYHVCKLMLAVVYNRFEEAVETSEEVLSQIVYLAGMHHVPDAIFYMGIAAAALHDKAPRERRPDLLERVRHAAEQMRVWGDTVPKKHAAKAALLAAELERLTGRTADAWVAYEHAIALASESQAFLDAPLALEAAYRGLRSSGGLLAAPAYLRGAHRLYAKWGATGKVQAMLAEHPHLARPQQLGNASGSLFSTTGNHIATVDLRAFVKAGQALSEAADLGALLETLIGIVMTAAGARRASLLLVEDTQLLVEADCSSDGPATVLQGTTIEAAELPRAAISYVRRSHKPLICDDATTHSLIRSDPQIAAQGIRSLLCLPLLHQGSLVGVLYAAHDLAANVFVPERIELLSLLSAQMASALERARLYSALEDRVRVRTAELEGAMRELEATQAQLVMREKMASLGNLVAGIAHEINTPLGALHSNTETTAMAVVKLRTLLSGTAPDKAAHVLETIESLTTVNLEAARRIKGIVTSLRQFARLDQAKRDLIDVHDGLDRTLTIIGHELRNRVEVRRDYGTLPKVACFPERLNQVFMNLLVNAAQAIEGEGEICIKTRSEQNEVVLSIADTGTGIHPDDLSRVFDPGFTTKGVKVGTGLGLSIVHRIVEEHGGRIEIESELGRGTCFILRLPVHPR